MKLYLMRHGHAVQEIVNPERPLSHVGRQQAQKIADLFKDKGFQINAIWYSSKLRAIETAEAVAKTNGVERLEKKEELKPNDPVQSIQDGLLMRQAENEDFHLMIVGHIPFLSNLAASLLDKSEETGTLSFSEGGVACLELHKQGKWELKWVLDPASMKAPSEL